MSYLASPFWLFQLIVGIALVLQTTYIRPEYFSQRLPPLPGLAAVRPRARARRCSPSPWAILLAPKLFGLILMLLDRGRAPGLRRRRSGSRSRPLIEIVLSALLAPILMLIQSGSVFQILLGRDTGWQPQRRDDGSIPFRDIVRRHRWHTLLGVFAGISAFLIATSLFLWMSPTIVGLAARDPAVLAQRPARRRAGAEARRACCMTPEERRPPPIATRANELAGRNARARLSTTRTASLALYARSAPARAARGDAAAAADRAGAARSTPDRALAEAKIVEAETIDEAALWLKPKERMVVLHDRALLDLAMRLKGAAAPAEAKAAAE